MHQGKNAQHSEMYNDRPSGLGMHWTRKSRLTSDVNMIETTEALVCNGIKYIYFKRH